MKKGEGRSALTLLAIQQDSFGLLLGLAGRCFLNGGAIP